MTSYTQIRDEILDWLFDNTRTIDDILFSLREEKKSMMQLEPKFYEEINIQYKARVKALIGEEISRHFGMPIDIIFEVLESSGIEEYLADDSLCFDDNSRKSASE